MAARRLLIVMLVLVGLSTLAAALVPPPEETTESSTGTTSTRAENARAAGGELVRASIDADSPRVETVRIPRGDQLALEVRSRRHGAVAIPRLGLLEDVAPGDPARFDILALEAGRLEVRRIEPRRRLGIVKVSAGG